jgi:hypothetical protein
MGMLRVLIEKRPQFQLGELKLPNQLPLNCLIIQEVFVVERFPRVEVATV